MKVYTHENLEFEKFYCFVMIWYSDHNGHSLNIFSLDGFYCNRIPGYILGSEHLLHFETILDLLLIILSGV